MSSEPNHQTSTSSLLHDQLLIPAETITVDESRDKNTSQSQKKDKEPVVVLLPHDEKDGQDHDSSGASKKLNHNAKERLRRMRLHASYLTLGTLLPNHSSSSKKKWSAPSIIDNVITYVSKLQNEIEELTHRKHKLEGLERQGRPLIRAISVLELGESGYEAVVQISMKKEKEDEFSNLLHVMEVQGLSILSASTSLVCRDQRVVCYNFHVKGKRCI